MSDVFVEDTLRPILPYETYGSAPEASLDGHIVLARLKGKKGQKFLARVFITSSTQEGTSYAKANDLFGGRFPYYSGVILQYIPLNGPLTFAVPELEGTETSIPSKMRAMRDYEETSLLADHVLMDQGRVSAENPLPKSLVLRYTDPQGVVWKVRSYPKPPKGQTKQVIAWTDQYNAGDEDDIVEGNTYDEIRAAMNAFQASRKRKMPSAASLAPVPTYSPGVKIYLENVPEEISDGSLTYKAFRQKDDKPVTEREVGKFYALADTPEGVKVLGPSAKFSDLERDLGAQKSKGMRAGLFGGSSDEASSLAVSSTDDAPKSLKELDLEAYLPWIGLGVGVLALGAVGYMLRRQGQKKQRLTAMGWSPASARMLRARR